MKKLDSYDAEITGKNELRKLHKQLEPWKDNISNESKKVCVELLTEFIDQSEKIYQVMTEVCKWQIKYNELQYLTNCLNENKKTLKLNECELQCKMVECKKNKKCIETELCSTTVINFFD